MILHIVCLRFLVFVLLQHTLYYSYVNALQINIHIGPHKTGTSHIQHYLTIKRQQLSDSGFCWPTATEPDSAPDRSGKALHNLSSHITTFQKIPLFIEEELKLCARKNMSIILSAEDFSTFNLSQVRLLKHLLVTSLTDEHDKSLHSNISFKVIIFYRDWISLVYSTFAEVSKKNEAKSTSISHYLFRTLDGITKLPQLDILSLISYHSEVFGLHNIILVDYNGVKAQGKDIAYVFVCEILKVLCLKSSILNTVAAKENEKPNIPLLHLIYLLRYYIQSLGYQFCVFDGEFIGSLVKFYKNRKNSLPAALPLIRSNLAFLQDHAHMIDQSLRLRYASSLLYNNVTASKEVIKSFVAEEIDEMSFYDDLNWMKFLSLEFNRLKKEKKVCKMNPSANDVVEPVKSVPHKAKSKVA
jgi:hypothetical protein